MMTVLTVDDESAALNILNRAILEVLPDAEIRSFSTAADALREIQEIGFRPEAAFLDIRLPDATGLEIARRIKESSPHTNLIFVTAYSDYALEATTLHSSGYLLKPATAEKVRSELDNLRYPPQREPGHRLRIQCFGDFEVFLDNRPLPLHYSKSKELLAYLVDRRGSACNTGELCAVLWPEEPDSMAIHKRLRKVMSDLTHALDAAGQGDALLKRRNSFAVNADCLDCDYYGMLNHNLADINTYTGEYMSQYSWAEMTLGALENRT
jgi:two-component SAPR family response regulator